MPFDLRSIQKVTYCQDPPISHWESCESPVGLRKCRIMEESQLQVWEAQLERRIFWSDFYCPWALNPIFNVLFMHCICPILRVLWSFHFYFSSSLHCIQSILFAVKNFSSCVNSFPLMKQWSAYMDCLLCAKSSKVQTVCQVLRLGPFHKGII